MGKLLVQFVARYATRCCWCLCFVFLPKLGGASEWRGDVAVEMRGFAEESEEQISVSFHPEWYWQAEQSSQQISLEIFARYDNLDERRSHVDVREFKWSNLIETAEIQVGMGRIYWGVTESLHLVDVINQTDLVESIDGEDKLGQPMLQLSHSADWGVVDWFWLPYFRERTFNSPEGRLSGPLGISENSQYESTAEQWHSDFALRFSQTYGNFDLGVSGFAGTNRDPKLILDLTNPQRPELVPYYDQSWQVAVDLQATLGAWLWKLEWMNKKDSIDHYWASVQGFEYTFFGAFDTAADVGVLVEYQFDDRPVARAGLGQNDAFGGMRLTLNDIQDTQFLAGLVRDLEFDETLLFIEADRRFGEAWRIALEARWFSQFDDASSYAFLNNQDHLSLSVEYHF